MDNDKETKHDDLEEDKKCEDTEAEDEGNYMMIGMSLGMALGMSLGGIIFDDIITGMSIGMCLGLAGGALTKRKKK